MNYKAILDEAWQQHLLPRSADAPTVISLFAGCGGSSLGYSMAGFRELLAVEWDDNAVATFRLNFPDVPIYHGDIAALSVADVLSRCQLQPGELDVLDGSPPCQGFSTAGKRVLDDPRNSLFREYVRLLRGLQPRVFIMENVSGMVKGKMKLVFADIMRELKDSGYTVSARLMNAMYFDVPQSRQRMIFIGVRSDLQPFSHPRATHRPITLRDALDNVHNTDQGIAQSMYKPQTRFMSILRQMTPGEGDHLYHPNGSLFGLRRLKWDKPSRTVLREDGGGASCQCCHPTETRRLTIPEVKRVQSLPDEFQLIGSVGEAWARVGNSVPPLFMRAIAQHVRENILTASVQQVAV